MKKEKGKSFHKRRQLLVASVKNLMNFDWIKESLFGWELRGSSMEDQGKVGGVFCH